MNTNPEDKPNALPHQPEHEQSDQTNQEKNNSSSPSGGGQTEQFIQMPEVPGIDLPKGGGAIKGMGEKFQANPVTGTASFSIPIAMSPGRSAFQPELSLSYNSGGGNSPFGLGWGVGPASISRKTQKGLPQYQDADESDTFLLAGAEDLVVVTENDGSYYERTEGNFTIRRYRPRIDNLNARIERWFNTSNGESHWKVTDTKNITTVLGETAAAREFDPGDSTKIFKWFPEYRYDALGNRMEYIYKRENSDGISPQSIAEKSRLLGLKAFNRLYLKEVKYGATLMSTDANFATQNQWHFRLILDYGEHDTANPTYATPNQWLLRQDPFSDYRAGFELRTYRLCRRILMFHEHFAELNSGAATLVKSTNLYYDENPTATVLNRVEHLSHELGQAPAALPPIDLKYSEANLDTNIHEFDIEDLENLPEGVEGQKYNWADPEGEGISGILVEDAHAWYYKRNLGDDSYYTDQPVNQITAPKVRMGKLETLRTKPSMGTAQQLSDIDGDGRPEVVIRDRYQGGFFEQDEEGDWKHFQYFDSLPNINWDDPNLRFVDLDGDGHADVLITESDCLAWHPSKAKAGFGERQKVALPTLDDQGPAILFSNEKEAVYTADMSGDGLSDLVRIRNGEVSYWPNLGYGHFGAKITLGNVSAFDHSDQFLHQRIRLADVDGSGTTDIIYIGNEAITYFRNLSGNALDNGQSIDQFSFTDKHSAVSVIDLLGKGTACLVWSSSLPADGPIRIRYMDLMSGKKPYLLEEVNNNMGAINRYHYAPSTQFYLRDRQEGRPWISKLPFPVQVLERVELYDQITESRFVSRYAYHHGYFDGIEREFRGFGMVEQWDTEQYEAFGTEGLFQVGSNALEEESHTPPVHTKTWFHLGFTTTEKEVALQYASEYYQADVDAWNLADSRLPENLSAEERRQAMRALKGQVLRSEVFADDNSALSDHPYTVSSANYLVQLVQAKGNQPYAVFRTIPQESLNYQYERQASDPRISHSILLAVDEYGQPTKSASIAYPRRSANSLGLLPQDTVKIQYAESDFVHLADSNTDYRIGNPLEQRAYEITGISLPVNAPVDRSTLLTDITTAVAINYEDNPSTEIEKRIIGASKVLYYNETVDAALVSGQIASHGLPYQQYTLALTQGLVDQAINADAPLVDENLLTNVMKYHKEDDLFWVPSPIMTFDASQFYFITESTDPFGARTTVFYDPYRLHAFGLNDDLGNTISATIDYRLLTTKEINDINANRQKVVFDTLGVVVKQVVMGKESGHFAYVSDEGDTEQNPTSTFAYSLDNFMLHGLPNYNRSTVREVHYHDDPSNSETLTAVSYFDGMGNVIQVRSQFGAEAGTNGSETPVTVSGRQIFNNKGLVVEAYEPYLDTGYDYKVDEEESATIDCNALGTAIENFVGTHGEAGLEDANLFKASMDTALGLQLTAGEYYEAATSYGIISHYAYLNYERGHSSNYGGLDFGNHSQHHFGAGDFTLEAWINPKTTDKTWIRATIFSNMQYVDNQFRGFHFYLWLNELWLEIGDPSGGVNAVGRVKGIGTIPFDTWTHVAASRIGNDISDWKFYINGAEVNIMPSSNMLNTGDISSEGVANLEIGSSFGSNSNFPLEGKVSAARLYNRALTPTEVDANYQQGLGGGFSIEAGLVFQALLDETTVAILSDSSDYEISGTRIGVQAKIDFDFNAAWAANCPPTITLAKIKMSHDALGRTIRTDLPDGTFTKVAFDCWQQKSYDQNDTVIDSDWYSDRNAPLVTDPEPSDPDERAAWLAAQHYNTPQLMDLDALGRVFRTRDDNGSFDGTSTQHVYYDVTVALDIEGKQRKVTNALSQETLFTYGILPLDKEGNGVILYTDSPDGGWRRTIPNVAGNPFKSWNERGIEFSFVYDILQRPTQTWVDEGAGFMLASMNYYGDNIGISTPELNNLRGQVVRSFDQTGMTKLLQVDFKGNILSSAMQFANEHETTVDWIGVAFLTDVNDVDAAASSFCEAESFSSVLSLDALNRPTLMTLPDGSQQELTYEKHGMLNTMGVQMQHESGFTAYVTNITYDAKGQRTNIYYGNGSKTRYDYNPESFRLERLLTTRNTGQDIMQDLNYTFDPVGNITEMTDAAQQTQYFSNTVIAPKGTYQYDALYRLLKATGREKENLSAPTSSSYASEMLNTNATSGETLSTYCENYTYDALGNMLTVRHLDSCDGSENWKRTYVYNSGMANNYLQSIYLGSTPPGGPQFSYDVHGNLEQMPHLGGMNWDLQDQLKMTIKSNEFSFYCYSAGQRTRKIVKDSSGRKQYERIYLGSYELYRAYDASETLETERVSVKAMDDSRMVALLEVKTMASGEPINESSRERITRYQYTNHLESAALELDENAAVISYEEYHPFGSTSFQMHTNDSEVSMKRYKYVHKERDDESGLYYYGARYYADWLCRFISVDPLKDKYPFYTTYQYAGNKPINFIDLDGLETTDNDTLKVDNNGQQYHQYEWPESSTETKSLSVPKTLYTTQTSPDNPIPYREFTVQDLKNLITEMKIEVDGASANELNITMTGVRDALFNSQSIGIFDLLNDPHSDYTTSSDKRAYLRGRIIGDAMATLMGFAEIEIGGGAAFGGLATGPGALVISTAGVLVATHGALASGVATSDLLISLHLYHSFSDDSSGNSSDSGGSGSSGNSPKEWELTEEGASKIKKHDKWGKFYKSKSDDLWWSVDKVGHGDSKFKVFKETKKGLEWYRDADEFGNFILNKHKGETGKFIPWGHLSTVK